MTRIEKLTPDQEDLMAVVRDDWLDFIFKNDQPMNEAAAKSGVAFLYGLAKLELPRVIIKESPMACSWGFTTKPTSKFEVGLVTRCTSRSTSRFAARFTIRLAPKLRNGSTARFVTRSTPRFASKFAIRFTIKLANRSANKN